MQLGSLHDDCALFHVFPHHAYCSACAWPMGCWADCANAHVSCVRVCNQQTCVPTCGQVPNVCNRHVTAAATHISSQLPATAKEARPWQPQPLPPHPFQPFPCTRGDACIEYRAVQLTPPLQPSLRAWAQQAALTPSNPNSAPLADPPPCYTPLLTCQHSQAATRPRCPRSTARRCLCHKTRMCLTCLRHSLRVEWSAWIASDPYAQ